MDRIAAELANIFGTQGFFDLTIAGRLFLAIAIGFLIGMEREIAGIHSGRHKLAGLRTITFVALLGAMSVMLDERGVLFLVLLVLLSAFFITAYVRNTIETDQRGLTTSFVALITFLLGAMVMRGETAVTSGGSPLVLNLTLFSVVIAITATLLLSLKRVLESTVASITPEEFFHSLKFLVVAFIILPFLPVEPVGSFVTVEHPVLQHVLDEVNLSSLWFMVVLIAGIGFAGYVLGKILGAGRGVVLSGFIGGLVSSTATMSAMAERSKTGKIVNAFAIAATVATVTSFFRVLLEVVVINPGLVSSVVVPLVVMALASIVAIILMRRHKEVVPHGELQIEHASPFALVPALKFTGFILAIKVLMVLAMEYELSGGLYLTSLISGLADVDAVTLNASSLAREGRIPASVASTAITLAVLSNMSVKAGIAILFGGPVFRKHIAAAFGGTIAAGLLTIGAIALFS